MDSRLKELFKDFDRCGDVIKNLEDASETRVHPGAPVIIRLDGHGFSKFTKGLQKPFDENLLSAFRNTVKHLVEETRALVSYTQSDEITLVLSNPLIIQKNSAALIGIEFNGRIQKYASLVASKASVFFYREIQKSLGDKYTNRLPHFDARVFSVPNLSVAALAVGWRQMDGMKNSVSSAAHATFGHKAILNKSTAQKLEMMSEAGINFWHEYPEHGRNGIFFLRKKMIKALDQEILARIPENKREANSKPVERSVYLEVGLPKFASIVNVVDVLFEPSCMYLQIEQDDEKHDLLRQIITRTEEEVV